MVRLWEAWEGRVIRGRGGASSGGGDVVVGMETDGGAGGGGADGDADEGGVLVGLRSGSNVSMQCGSAVGFGCPLADAGAEDSGSGVLSLAVVGWTIVPKAGAGEGRRSCKFIGRGGAGSVPGILVPSASKSSFRPLFSCSCGISFTGLATRRSLDQARIGDASFPFAGAAPDAWSGSAVSKTSVPKGSVQAQLYMAPW